MSTKKTREALMEAKRTLQYLFKPELAPFDGDNRRIVDTIKIIDAALSDPSRNCDVGTAESQLKRFYTMCGNYNNCEECPCYTKDCCGPTVSGFAKWEQMPYTKGGND